MVMKKHLNWAETIGWLGAILTLLSYGLLSTGIVAGDSIVYHSLILIGALGLMYITFVKKTFQPFVVNTVFALLATIALVRIYLNL